MVLNKDPSFYGSVGGELGLKENLEDSILNSDRTHCWCGKKLMLVSKNAKEGTFLYACPLFLAGDESHDSFSSEEELFGEFIEDESDES